MDGAGASFGHFSHLPISQFFNTFAFFAQVVELGEAVDRLEKEEELGCAE